MIGGIMQRVDETFSVYVRFSNVLTSVHNVEAQSMNGFHSVILCK